MDNSVLRGTLFLLIRTYSWVFFVRRCKQKLLEVYRESGGGRRIRTFEG
ncbi:protein of unknown function [Moritella yayanosii]|uniref:Uncharacterized protein n=1 Tax=Moritella yayanosii TaxID=69539 RepID=A0A330LVW0_9GAMM|nr:protein of unknown function [Moritella yayanosii]